MTEEELKERLLEIIADCYRIPYPLVIEQILTLIKDAGWKSLEDVTWIISQTIINRDKQLIEKGWKGPEEIKQKMKDILSEHQLASEYETDARYVWPERWIKLMEYFKEGPPMDEPKGGE